VASEVIIFMPHKRSNRKLQERKIRGIILQGSFYDKNRGEIVSTMTRIDIMGLLNEPVEVHLVPDIEKGEVLIDPKGKGSMQKLGS
jgi:hypothetical protein